MIKEEWQSLMINTDHYIYIYSDGHLFSNILNFEDKLLTSIVTAVCLSVQKFGAHGFYSKF